mgnify:FL=1
MTSASSPVLGKILKGQLCTGCGLCAGLSEGAVEMETVTPGYSRPRQIRPIADTTEAVIAAACPGSRVAPWPDAPHRHPYWGPYFRSMTGHATDARVRHAGSSGGVVTALAIHALATGLVDKVLHIMADPDHPTRNVAQWSTSADEVISGAGSRYASSSPLAYVNAALENGQRFAFIGKPCDVSALRQLALVDPRVNALVPLMLSFFCAGIPSHDGADRIIHAMGLVPDDVAAFRYRGNGWPGLTVAETHDGRRGEMRYSESWGGHLSREVQFRCKICPDGVGGVADVACADAWYGGEAGYPTFEEQDGRSLILSRTATGEALLQSALEQGRVMAEGLMIEEVDLMQPAQARRKRLVAARLTACSAMLQPKPVMKGLNVKEASRTAKLTEKLKNMVGMMRRIGTDTR